MEQCPCGSGKTYQECCEIFITEKDFPQTPEQLMRSRYTAYVKTEVAHILRTILPKQLKDIDEKGIRSWSEKTHWRRLEILRTENGGPDDKEGIVEFIAHFKDKGLAGKHHEIAKFKKYKDKWYYEDSEFPAPKQVVRSEPKVKRNDPCPCGSGKKYKKCCGN